MTQTTSNQQNKIKFLYSYGGKIVPRCTDGALRYTSGFTRVLSVDRSVTFSELMVKFGELCGSSMNLKCKLPTEDLDLLISVKSDEDLMNVIEEYERRASPGTQIRAVLFPVSLVKKKLSSPQSPVSCFDFPSKSSRFGPRVSKAAPVYATYPPSLRAYGCHMNADSYLAGYPGVTRRFSNQQRIPVQFCRISHRKH